MVQSFSNMITQGTDILLNMLYNIVPGSEAIRLVISIIIIAALYRGLSILIQIGINAVSVSLLMHGVGQKVVKRITLVLQILDLLMIIGFLSGAYLVFYNLGGYLDMDPSTAKTMSSGVLVLSRTSRLWIILPVFMAGILWFSKKPTAAERKKTHPEKMFSVIYLLTWIYLSSVVPVGMTIYWIARSLISIPYQKGKRFLNRKISALYQIRLSQHPEKYRKYLAWRQNQEDMEKKENKDRTDLAESMNMN